MNENSELEIISMSSLYRDMKQPISLSAPTEESYSIIRQRIKTSISAPDFQCGAIKCEEAPFEYSEVSVAYFPNAVLTKTGALIVRDKYVIAETLEGSLTANRVTADTAKDLAACETSDEIVISCNKHGTWNYSLYLMEVAPALYIASLIPELARFSNKLFFESFMSPADVENRLLIADVLGFNRSRISRQNTELCRYKGVVVVKVNDRHKSQRLTQMLSPVVATVRQGFTKSANATPRRIYISRQSAPSRKIKNFEDLNRSVFAKHGIAPVELEKMSVVEQVDMFTKADLVIAEHGAGLVNISFMRPGSVVIEIMPSTIAGRAVYRYIAHHSRLIYFYASIPVEADWRWDHDDLTAPLEMYEELLTRALQS
jgi:hypothetical protein